MTPLLRRALTGLIVKSASLAVAVLFALDRGPEDDDPWKGEKPDQNPGR